MTFLFEEIVNIFRPLTSDSIKIMAYREMKAPRETAQFIIETKNDLIRLPLETMVEVCAKMGNYLGMTKMEIPFRLSSIPKVEEKISQKSEPSSPSPLPSVKTVEIR